jgi:signal transduction histidine kinase/CHASE3 domain sensor protein/ActR/RegA family two-component response regulator
VEWSAERKIEAGFAFALACVVLIAVVAFVSLEQLTRDAGWVAHSVSVRTQLQRLAADLTAAESSERDFLLTADRADLDSYRRDLGAAEHAYGALTHLTTDNALEQRRLRQLAPLIDARLAGLTRLIDLRQTEGFAAAQAQAVRARAHRGTVDRIADILQRMGATEGGLFAQRQVQTHRRTLSTEETLAGGGVLAFLVAGLALVVIRRDFAGRRRAEAALRALNGELESRVAQRTAELARVNDSLAQSERRFRALVNATSDVIYQMSPDWSEMRYLQGRNFMADQTDPSRTWLDTYIHPDDQQRMTAAIENAIRTRSTFQLEYRVHRVDGTLGWAASRAVPLEDEAGRIIEWFGAASDVTERREAQDKLEAQLARLSLLDAVTRAMGERQDVDSIFQVVIRTLETQLGLDFCSISEYDAGENCLTVMRVGGDSAPLARELAMAERATIPIDRSGLSRCVRGELVYEAELAAIAFPFAQRLARAGLRALVAAPLHVESRVFGVLLAARRAPGSFSSGECEFLRQLSEHVALAAYQAQLYQALQRAYEDLRQTQQAVLQHERLLALGTMASGIAHDVNNAISPIMLYTDMLLEDRTLPADVRNPLQVIQRAVDQVAHTVERMREFYRPREPHQALSPVNLNALVIQVLDLTRARWSDMPQRQGVQIELETALEAHLPPVPGVETELRDAVTNLVFNAADAMPRGGRLSLRTQSIGPAGSSSGGTGQVRLEVGDTGVGMDEATRARCLEPFFTTKGERGTGLGLPMVFGTMQRHGGEIEIASTPGAGTRVTLSFPVALEGGVVYGVPPPLAVAPRRILLVDDDPSILFSTREALSGDGHTVVTADGGRAGIDAFRAAQAAGEPYEVVITDLGMPYVDGRQVAAAVKAACPQTLVLLLTGWGRRLVEEGDVPTSVDSVLSKPPRLRELREALAQQPGASKR